MWVRNSRAQNPSQQEVPVQPVERPVICKPYAEPNDHWVYDKRTGDASRAGVRRPASYWYLNYA